MDAFCTGTGDAWRRHARCGKAGNGQHGASGLPWQDRLSGNGQAHLSGSVSDG